ncbi:MAG: bifunctional nuclease family protein [Coriobacteriia bacterium]
MVRVRIESLNIDALTNSPVVLLKVWDESDDRVMPIWIGHAEAMAILLRLQNVEPPRPLTHDLMRDVIETLGYVVERVEITRLEESTFFAALVLRSEERSLALDARPSDSMALAVRTGAPIYVADDVWETASLSVSDDTDEEEEVKRFREFLEHVDPSDFEL